MDPIAEIVLSLSEYATVRPTKRPGLLFLDSLHGENLDPPAQILVTEESARQYIERTGAEKDLVFPESTVEEAGLAFLLIHLQEELDKIGPGATLIVTGKDLKVKDSKIENWTGRLDPEAEYHWSAYPPDGPERS